MKAVAEDSEELHCLEVLQDYPKLHVVPLLKEGAGNLSCPVWSFASAVNAVVLYFAVRLGQGWIGVIMPHLTTLKTLFGVKKNASLVVPVFNQLLTVGPKDTVVVCLTCCYSYFPGATRL